MIQIYNDGKGQSTSFEATIADHEALGLQPIYGLGASPQEAATALMKAVEQHIAILQALDYTEVVFIE
jgi:hypothetical protein